MSHRVRHRAHCPVSLRAPPLAPYQVPAQVHYPVSHRVQTQAHCPVSRKVQLFSTVDSPLLLVQKLHQLPQARYPVSYQVPPQAHALVSCQVLLQAHALVSHRVRHRAHCPVSLRVPLPPPSLLLLLMFSRHHLRVYSQVLPVLCQAFNRVQHLLVIAGEVLYRLRCHLA